MLSPNRQAETKSVTAASINLMTPDDRAVFSKLQEVQMKYNVGPITPAPHYQCFKAAFILQERPCIRTFKVRSDLGDCIREETC